MDESTINTGLEAWRETASTTGKIVEQFGKLASYFEGMLNARAGQAEDNAQFRRWKNRLKLYDKAQKILAERNIETPTRNVPLSFAAPLLSYGSLQEDDELQNRWAQLLANAADASSGVELRTTYVDILKDLSAVDVTILAIIAKLSHSDFPQIPSTAIETGELPSYARVHVDLQSVLSSPSVEVTLSLSNLVRLGCISPSVGYGGGAQNFDLVYVTPLGMGLYRACVK